jgi:hypothetical protein
MQLLCGCGVTALHSSQAGQPGVSRQLRPGDHRSSFRVHSDCVTIEGRGDDLGETLCHYLVTAPSAAGSGGRGYRDYCESSICPDRAIKSSRTKYSSEQTVRVECKIEVATARKRSTQGSNDSSLKGAMPPLNLAGSNGTRSLVLAFQICHECAR